MTEDGSQKIGMFNGRPPRVFDSSQFSEFHFLRNILIAGSVGSGKTNLAKVLIQRVVELGDVLVLDVKGEYQDIIGWAQTEGYQATALTIGREPYLKLNPLEPPVGVTPSVWVGCVADIITRCYRLGEPSRRILQDCIHALYRNHWVSDVRDHCVTWPTLRELELVVAEFPTKSTREINSRRALESRLHLMTTGELGKSLNTMVGFDPVFFVNRVVSVELDWVNSVRDQRVIGELLVSALWEYRKANETMRNRMAFICFEEAHRFLPESRSRWEQGTRTLLERCFAEGRTYGMALVALDQQPALLSRYVLANTGTKFAGRLSSHEDVQRVADALVMQEELVPEFQFRKLLPGEMFAQILFTQESTAEWGIGYQRYQIPRFQPAKYKPNNQHPAESDNWYRMKLRTALMNTYLHVHRNRWGKEPPPYLLKELEYFIKSQLHGKFFEDERQIIKCNNKDL